MEEIPSVKCSVAIVVAALSFGPVVLFIVDGWFLRRSRKS